jgi:uncharacterized protein YgiM (DUF1202 family)
VKFMKHVKWGETINVWEALTYGVKKSLLILQIMAVHTLTLAI